MDTKRDFDEFIPLGTCFYIPTSARDGYAFPDEGGGGSQKYIEPNPFLEKCSIVFEIVGIFLRVAPLIVLFCVCVIASLGSLYLGVFDLIFPTSGNKLGSMFVGVYFCALFALFSNFCFDMIRDEF